MIGDKRKFLSLKGKDKENNAPTKIKGKGVASLDQNIEAQNVLYVEGLKQNLLSVSQMCDNGCDVTF